LAVARAGAAAAGPGARRPEPGADPDRRLPPDPPARPDVHRAACGVRARRSRAGRTRAARRLRALRRAARSLDPHPGRWGPVGREMRGARVAASTGSARAVARAGVVGLGTMGAGIAQLCVQAGVPTVACDTSAERAEEGRARIAGWLARGVERGRLGE